MAGLDAAAILAVYDSLKSHAQSLKLFQAVTEHEPLNPPAGGLSCAILLGPLTPLSGGSGLAATSGRLEFHVRIYAHRSQYPSARIERDVLGAACTLMGAYSADFELLIGNIASGLVRDIDLLGRYGAPLSMTPGWLAADGAPFRIADITLPLILNDIFGQVA